MNKELIAKLVLNGRAFSVYTAPDADSTPFDFCDHVTDWVRRGKRPGEMILNKDRESYRFFDFQSAVSELRKEGCKGPQAHASAMSQFDYIRRWCADQWYYVGVIVEDDADGETESVWGVESDSADYIRETATDLAHELMGSQQDLFDAPAEWVNV